MEGRTAAPGLLVFMSYQEVDAISGHRIQLGSGSRDNGIHGEAAV
jgi:hypothetical protein